MGCEATQYAFARARSGVEALSCSSASAGAFCDVDSARSRPLRPLQRASDAQPRVSTCQQLAPRLHGARVAMNASRAGKSQRSHPHARRAGVGRPGQPRARCGALHVQAPGVPDQELRVGVRRGTGSGCTRSCIYFFTLPRPLRSKKGGQPRSLHVWKQREADEGGDEVLPNRVPRYKPALELPLSQPSVAALRSHFDRFPPATDEQNIAFESNAMHIPASLLPVHVRDSDADGAPPSLAACVPLTLAARESTIWLAVSTHARASNSKRGPLCLLYTSPSPRDS